MVSQDLVTKYDPVFFSYF